MCKNINLNNLKKKNGLRVGVWCLGGVHLRENIKSS